MAQISEPFRIFCISKARALQNWMILCIWREEV
jgi:hypothetical protein